MSKLFADQGVDPGNDAKFNRPWIGRFMKMHEISGLTIATLNDIVAISDSFDEAQDNLLEWKSKEHGGNLPGPGGTPVHGGDQTLSNPAFFAQAASDALLARMTGKPPEGPARELASLSLLEIGVRAAELGGRRILRNRSKQDVAMDIMMSGGQHTTSDFSNLLTGTGQRFLQQQYQAMQSPMKRVGRQRDAVDFRSINVLRISEAPGLLVTAEGAEVKFGTMSETKETYALLTYARQFSLSRQAIINDDLSAFTDMARGWGLAAATCEADVIAALFTANSGNGANLADGNAFFTTGRGNKTSGAGSVLQDSSLDLGRQFLRGVKGLDGKTPLNLQPTYLVTGGALEGTALKIANSTIVPTKTADVNTFSTLTPLVEPRFTDNSWRLFADPAVLPAFEYAYLAGAAGPIVRQRDGWDVLGIDFQAYHEFGAGLTEYRAAFLGVGA